MKKATFGALAVLLMLGLVIAGCSDAMTAAVQELEERTVTEFDDPIENGGPYDEVVITDVTDWGGKKEMPHHGKKTARPKKHHKGGIDIEVVDPEGIGENEPFGILEVEPLPSSRTNSGKTGYKISSNAHSHDVPGMTFHWGTDPDKAGKQQDLGWLKVHESVFQRYVYFVLTAQNSNEYYDYVIMPQVGQLTNEEGCYVFFVGKPNGKNINNVFIDLFQEKLYDDDPPTIINPPIIEGNKYIIISTTSVLGAEVDYKNKWLFSGVPIKDYWNNTLSAAYPGEFAAMKAIASADGETATWIWDREDSWTYGISGAQTIVYASRFNISGTINEASVPFYFACDNAAAMYVNGELVKFTEWAFKDRPEPGPTSAFRFEGFGDAVFDGAVWQHMYEVNIKGYLVQGYNEILIVAANSDDNDGIYDETNNPAGLIFASQFSTSK